MNGNAPTFSIGQIVRYKLSVELDADEQEEAHSGNESDSQRTVSRWSQNDSSMAGIGWRFKKSRAKITAIAIEALETQYTIEMQVFFEQCCTI
jgi:hypothetical protein